MCDRLNHQWTQAILEAQGEPKRFSHLVELAERSVFTYLRVQTGDDHLAADITQQTFMNVLIGLDSFVPIKANGRTWIMAIARNAFITELRRKSPCSLEEVLLHETDDHCSRSPGVDDDKALGPDRQADFPNFQFSIHDALSILTRAERLVIVLRYWEDMDRQQIANVLSVTPLAVSVAHSRALNKLRMALGPDAQDRLDWDYK